MTEKRAVCSRCGRLWTPGGPCGNCGHSEHRIVEVYNCAECGRNLAHSGSDHCWRCLVEKRDEIDHDFWTRADQARQVAASEEMVEAITDVMVSWQHRGCPRMESQHLAAAVALRWAATVLGSDRAEGELGKTYTIGGSPSGMSSQERTERLRRLVEDADGVHDA